MKKQLKRAGAILVIVKLLHVPGTVPCETLQHFHKKIDKVNFKLTAGKNILQICSPGLEAVWQFK